MDGPRSADPPRPPLGHADESDATVGRPVVQLGGRQRRLIDIALTLAVVALAFVVLGYLSQVFYDFGDIILTFFLAWLVAFVISPIVERIGVLFPQLPRVIAVATVYAVLFVVLGIVILNVAEALARSIADFVQAIPSIQASLPEVLSPIQQQLNQLGLQVDAASEANGLISNVGGYASTLIGPLQSIAVASLGVLGMVLIVVILSVYIVIDSNNIRSFAFRLLPPQYHDEGRVFERSVARSFGGFLRGQVAMGIIYGLIAVAANAAFGLPFLPVTSAAAGLLQMVPFFGPFISWAPPVLVAILTSPGAIVPTLLVMGVGWFIVMNVVQPRLMQEAIGLHPIIVLGSVLVGSRVAGVAGAVFGIPVAAVLTSIFFYYFRIFGAERTVRERAAHLVEGRERRTIRVPREPQPGVDTDIEDGADGPAAPGGPIDARASEAASVRAAEPAPPTQRA